MATLYRNIQFGFNIKSDVNAAVLISIKSDVNAAVLISIKPDVNAVAIIKYGIIINVEIEKNVEIQKMYVLKVGLS